MTRFSGVLLFASFVTGAFAQSQPQSQTRAQTPASAAAAVAAASTIAPGNYTGTVQEQGGSRTATVKMTIRDVTKDGRVTATVESSHARASCAKRLPLNGLVLPEGQMRLTVDDGAPEGCERIYHLKVASGGTLSGTFVDGRTAAKKKASASR
jgi:hypothetical protein